MAKENLLQRALKRSREGWLGKALHVFDGTAVGDEVWDELEEMLIAADVGVSTAGKLIAQTRQRVDAERIREGERVREVLIEVMAGLLSVAPAERTGTPRPRVTLLVGVNGGGKTTSIAKLAYRWKKEGKKVLLAAADTFRAGAIDQLKVQGQRAGVEVIAHQPGADPGAVVYDALQAAESRGSDEVIVDTAGRLHTKVNLMEELKKIGRVAGKLSEGAPHQVVLVIDATTGQNGLLQARHFTEAVGVTGIFLTKLDGTARGGIVLAISDELGIPIEYVGTGEQLEDMALFDARAFVEALCS
ncbi:MAG: signal recognition particle-docking protein FtsY [Chloroflexota bacterium]